MVIEENQNDINIPKSSNVEVKEENQNEINIPKSSNVEVKEVNQNEINIPKSSNVEVKEENQNEINIPKATNVEVKEENQNEINIPKATKTKVLDRKQKNISSTKASDTNRPEFSDINRPELQIDIAMINGKAVVFSRLPSNLTSRLPSNLTSRFPATRTPKLPSTQTSRPSRLPSTKTSRLSSSQPSGLPSTQYSSDEILEELTLSSTAATKIKKMQTEEQEEASKMDTMEESVSDEVFASYKCTSLHSNYKCVKHPGNIVEAGSLAAQSLPEATYHLNNVLPEEVFSQGLLSDLQTEGVLFACQRHQLILPNEYRAGFFLADGTGVGKGRQIAGIILDNICRGRNKHIWFSVSNDLRQDAQRDLRDIGCYVTVIDGCQQLDKGTKGFGLVSEYKEGVLFSTYSTLVSASLKDGTKTSRLQQLIDWCGGKEFSGCLVFDESHKAKHFLPGKEKKSTKVALAVTTIQRMLPKARVVYCSATGVTDVKNMAFMERLGLWGKGTLFHDFEAFHESLTKRGLGALEMLSMEMKAAGMYVSRGLSYQDAEFLVLESKLTSDQIVTYNQATKIWLEIKRCLQHACNYITSTPPNIWTQYWACHQRFFKQLCMSMKVPEIVRQAKEALNSGHCVVIGLQTTGEASLDSELDQNDGELKGFISLTKEILFRFVLQFFPTEVSKNREASKPHDWCVEAKTLLLEFIDKIQLPNSPLDQIIDELGGPKCVAEMTGRKGFIGRLSKKERPKYLSRGSNIRGTESINLKERNSFMNGDKLIAIISDAASTGISLHADERAENQRRRVHITAELPWSADKAVQQLGRSHRSNQSSSPIYKLVTSDLGGERRFAAAVARRLQSLGAITKGDRRAATGADLTQFNFDTQYGRQAIRTMYESIGRKEIVKGVTYFDITRDVNSHLTVSEFHDVMKQCLIDMDMMEAGVAAPSVKEKNKNDVTRFLNRILGLDVKHQNLIFRYFSLCLDAATEAAKREGRFNDGVTDVRGNSIVMVNEPAIVFKEVQLGASITRRASVDIDRGVPFDQALEKCKQSHDKDTGFYRSKRDQYGKKLFLLAVQKEQKSHLFTITRPNTGVSPFEEDKTDIFMKYDRIDENEARLGWTEQYEQTKDSCIHGNSCKSKEVCTIGSRVTHTNLLMGRILSILPVLESVVAKFAHALQLPRDQQNLRVVRMELDSGKRIIGLRYPGVLISEAERTCVEFKEKEKEKSGHTIFAAVVENESPLIKKSRHKAMTKPLTLKNYFAKAEKANTTATQKDITLSSGALAREYSVELNSEDMAQTESTSSSLEVTCSKSTLTKKLAQKRSLSTNENGPVNGLVKKQRKQTNIFNLLVDKVEKSKQTICPVCRKNLTDLSNEKVNNHVDNCLIE